MGHSPRDGLFALQWLCEASGSWGSPFCCRAASTCSVWRLARLRP
jgi:hypothetical protein